MSSDIPSVICLKGKLHQLGSRLERAPNNYVYIGREFTMGGWNLPRSIWANRHKVQGDNREAVIELYCADVLNNPMLLQSLPSLKGKVLACWCHPNSCHGDILIELYKQYVQ